MRLCMKAYGPYAKNHTKGAVNGQKQAIRPVGALGDDRLLLARVLDRARQASERNVPAATDFLSPAQQAMAMDMLRTAGISDTAYVRLGGYDDAERALLLFLPDWLDAADAEGQSPIRCLRAQFRADEKLTHRDFLGSLMGMGIIREKLGDILVSPDSADLMVLDTVADFLLQSWNTAAAPAECLRNRAGHLHIPGGPVRGAAGHRFLPTAGRRVRHGLPHGPG